MKAKITFARQTTMEGFLDNLRVENNYLTVSRMAACHDISFVVEIGDVANLERVEELAEEFSGRAEFSKEGERI